MKMLFKGNEAIARAAILAGCDAFFGYPITPQNEIPEYMSKYLAQNNGVFVQSESEIAAINMVYGASASGKRVMTSSSSPGIALKQEGISYLVGAKLPAVIVSVSRAGPGLGGILPSQADYFQATRGGGNGDYHLPVYAPSTIQEATDLVQKAFNVADMYRTPVMVLVDGIIGQMMEPVEFKDIPRADVDKEEWAASGNSDKRQRNIVNSLYLLADDLEEHNNQLNQTYMTITANEVMYDSDIPSDCEYLFVSYGTASRIVINTITLLKEQGYKAGYIRPITLWPFPQDIFNNLPATIKKVIVAELSMGQMIEDVKLAIQDKNVDIAHYGRVGGNLFEPSDLVDFVLKGGNK